MCWAPSALACHKDSFFQYVKERFIVSGGSKDCLCLYIFLCLDMPEKENRFPFVALRQQR